MIISRQLRTLGVPILAPFLVTGCGDADSARPAGGSAGMDSPDFTIAPESRSLWTVGALDGEDWEIIGSVTDLTFSAAGDLFLLDGQAGHVVVFDREGRYLWTISRRGEGPGELVQPRSMAVLADGRLAVFDRGRNGIQFFTQDGDYLDSAPFDLEQGTPTRVNAWLPDGSIITDGEMQVTGTSRSMSIRSSVGGSGDETGRPIALYRPDGSRELLYTAWEPPPPTGDGAEAAGGGISLRMSPTRAFDPGLSFVALSDGRLAVVDSSGYRIKLIGEGGVVAGVLARPVSPIAVTESVQDAERERQLSALEGGQNRVSFSFGGALPAGVSLPDNLGDQINAARKTGIEQMTFADVIPASGDLTRFRSV
ncbi:6-bladed beta-propeller [Candidatus Palauibacter sp.]|uniref:6-bladed beta-propeller n=1 Tax=Candidatus Palauibacter sp. TaxID=3101350 RepID=UPI003B5B9C01